MARWIFAAARHAEGIAARTHLLALVLSLMAGSPVRASGDPSGICDHVARVAAAETGVPLSVLKAISLTETGRKRSGRFRPWPWTINMEGKGVWFDTPGEARSYVDQEFRRGARSFDVGCFQINYKWHGDQFRSLDDMFDPMTNARYAARLLKTLHAETADWGLAAGAYHSRNPKFADRYRTRFERIRADIAGDAGAEIPEIPDIVLAAAQGSAGAPRVNRYPLLLGGGTGGLGSLVPLGGSAVPLFGAAPAGAD